MSNDWLPEDAEGYKRILINKIYMEPDWTRTKEGVGNDTHVTMNGLYKIFDIYKEDSRIIAEGNFFLIF